jgi:hypothetical protein
MGPLRASLGLFLAAATAVGCARQPKLATVTDEANGAAPAEDATIVVDVVSHAFHAAAVFLNVGASRRRLGLANGNTTSRFVVPWNAQIANANQASLVAEKIGDEGSVESSSLRMEPGVHIVWTLSLQFYESGLEVY